MLNKFVNFRFLFLKFFVLFFLILSSFSYVYSENYYADIEIDIFEDGSVTINGVTNYAGLKNISNSQNYTSKKGEMWIFNLTTDEVFEDFIFKINFPAGVQINYIKTTPRFRIEDNGDSISLIGIGDSQELNILIQYKIIKDENSSGAFFSVENYFFIFSFVLFLFVLFIIYLAYSKFKIFEKNEFPISKNVNPNNNINSNVKELINLDLLSGRQKEIVEILLKRDKISQKELQEILKIPKSSVSRNVNSLVSRGFIVKQRSGITTFISLKK